MNAYLFCALATIAQVRPNQGHRGPAEELQVWDSFDTSIILAENPETAQTQFEGWLQTAAEGENPRKVRIKKLSAAQLVDQLLTESGAASLDWMAIVQQSLIQLESTPVDDFEQGYWVDVDQCIRPEKLSFDVATLQQELPEDIRSGLNWSSEKKFYFVLSVLTPPPAPPPPPPGFTDSADAESPQLAEIPDEDSAATDIAEVQRLLALYPQGADKEAAALIQARNSVVAAWIWRKYAADTNLVTNQIRIDPFCGVMGIQQEEDQSPQAD